nr:hypothetical protein [uncultured Dyadobacter sp.]
MKAPRIALIVLSTLALWLVVIQFFFCPRYEFRAPTPFQGPVVANPYESAAPSQWIKCNFHAHARAWSGVTNGHGTPSDVHKAYQELGYGVHCVSNYHHIDSTGQGQSGYLSAYEHGYNILKTHQLVLGSKQVTWLDYIFPQTPDNKQHLLNALSEPGNLVILNHPALRRGYTPEDLALLTNYDCMEVLNPSVTSTREWDAALSAGRRAFIVGDDDIHDIISRDRLGVRCTFVNASHHSGSEVISALKAGRSYGVIVGKDQHYADIPGLVGVTVRKDSVIVEMNRAAQDVTLTGQNGRLLAKTQNTSSIAYRIKPGDHYARATFTYANGTTIFLNPVYFTDPKAKPVPPVSENRPQTILFRLTGAFILAAWTALITGFGARKQLSAVRKERALDKDVPVI